MNLVRSCTKVLRICVKWFYLLFAVGIILLAVIVQAGRSFSPLLSEHKQDLCDYLSEKLHAKVSMASISAEWDGLKPMVDIHQLRIENSKNESILSLDHAQMRLDLLGSLLHARLVWTQLSLSKTEMNFVQSPLGYWKILGVEPKSNLENESSSAQLDLLIDMSLLSRRIEFQQTQLNFKFASGEQSTLSSPLLEVENSGDFHRLALQVDINARPKSLYLVVEGRGDPRKKEKFSSKGFIKLNQFPTNEPVAATTAFLLHGINAEVHSEGTLDASLWFSSRANHEGFDLVGKLGVQRVSLPILGKELSLDKFSSDVVGYWLYGSRWQVALQNINAKVNENVVRKLNFAASASGFDDPVILHLQQVDLKRLHRALEDSSVLGSGHLHDAVAKLSPEGILDNVQIIIPSQNPNQAQLRAELKKVGVNAWHGVPALHHIDGYLQVDKSGGFVDINSHHGFSMHYDPTYAAPMEYEQATGQVAWKLDIENNQIFVNSGKLEFINHNEVAHGYMWLSMPWIKDTADTDLYLQIGAENLTAGAYKKYTPSTIPVSLMNWLDRAIGVENIGEVSDVGFLYRGSLNGHNHQSRSFQLGLQLDNATLNYSPGWPALTKLKSTLWVGDERVTAQVYSANLFDSQVNETHVDVFPNPSDKGSLLKIKGSVSGSALDGLRALRETKLRDQVGNNFDAWTVIGRLRSDISLAIPLESNAKGAEEIVDLELDADRLTLKNLNLVLSHVNGKIGFSSGKGLSSENLNANFLGEKIALELSDHKVNAAKGGEVHETWIDAKGEVDANQIANWSHRPEILFLAGTIPFQMQVKLHPTLKYAITDEQKPFADISIFSTLEGVDVNLPEPFGKSLSKNKKLQLTMSLDENRSDIKVNYADQVQAWVQLDPRNQYRLRNATIALNEKAELSSSPKFWIKGKLNQFDLPVWQKVFSDYKSYQQQLNTIPLNAIPDAEVAVGDVMGLKVNADIELKHYALGGLNFENIRTHIEPIDNTWKLSVLHSDLVGDIFIPQNQQLPWKISLQKLRILNDWFSAPSQSINTAAAIVDLEEAQGSVIQPSAGKALLLESEKIPALDLSVERLIFVNQHSREERLVGNGSFELRPQTDGFLFEKIKGEFLGINVGGNTDEGARLEWKTHAAQPRSHFLGVLSANNVATVLKSWQKPELMESTKAKFDVDVFWNGNPQDFSLKEMEGKSIFSIEKGRFKQSPAGGGDGFLRLMAILNFDSLARRLRFDFSDLYQSGLAFDQISGVAEFQKGMLIFDEPLVVKSPSSKLQLVGKLDLDKEHIDARLIATLPVVGNYTFFTALVGGLPAAAGIYVVSKLFKKQVDQATSLSYSIHGGWENPEIRFDRLFESEKSLRNSLNTPNPAPTKIKQKATDNLGKDKTEKTPEK